MLTQFQIETKHYYYRNAYIDCLCLCNLAFQLHCFDWFSFYVGRNKQTRGKKIIDNGSNLCCKAPPNPNRAG